MARKRLYLVVDTETTNTLDDPFVYDLGMAVIDKTGKVYESYSFVIYDVYVGLKSLMQTAYYKNKLPLYEKELKSGKRKMVTFYTARKKVIELISKWDIYAVIAHNMQFDYRALNTTQRFLSKSKYRYFFPYGTRLWCSLRMSRSIFKNKPTYKRFCIDNNYVYGKNKIRLTAEIIYRFITRNDNFIENHTGLEDVLIEKEIFAYLKRQHKKMDYLAFPS